MWSRVRCPQWLLSRGRLIVEVWRDSLGVEQITGFGCLVCEHHRSVPVVSLGVCGVEERVFQGGGGLLIFILGEGGSTLTLRCIGWSKTLLV